MVTTVILLILYFTVIIGIGFYFTRFVKSENDFWLAGRTIGPWVSAFSYAATWYSAVALIGSPAFIYTKGLAMGVWTAFGATWLFVIGPTMVLGVPLRRMTERLNAITLPEWMGERFDSRLIRGFAAICLVLLFIPYITAITKGTANALQVFVNLPYVWGTILTGVVVAIYMTLSGYYGVVWTDFFQGWIMLISLVIALIVALVKAGGIGAAVSTLNGIDPNLVAATGGLQWPMFLSMALVWGVVTWGQPQTIIRFLGLKSPRQMKSFLVIAMFASVLIIFPCYMLGVLGRVFYPTEFLKSPDLLIPTMIKALLPGFFGSIFLCSVLAASMSTLDSVALVAASSAVRDFYEKLILAPKGQAVDQKSILKISRLVTAVVVFLGILLAIKPPGIIWQISVFATGSIAATIAASLLYGVYWKRSNWQGSFASMIIGLSVTLFCYFAKVKFMHPYLVGMIVSFIAFPVFTWIFPPPPKELVERAYG